MNSVNLRRRRPEGGGRCPRCHPRGGAEALRRARRERGLGTQDRLRARLQPDRDLPLLPEHRDIIEHLRLEGHTLLAARLRRVDPKLPALERVRAMGRAYWRFALEHRGYYALMFTLRAAETPRREAVQREMATLFILRDVVVRGIETGELRRDLDPTVVTNVLWAKIHGVAALAVSGLLVQTAPGHHEEVLEEMLESAA